MITLVRKVCTLGLLCGKIEAASIAWTFISQGVPGQMSGCSCQPDQAPCNDDSCTWGRYCADQDVQSLETGFTDWQTCQSSCAHDAFCDGFTYYRGPCWVASHCYKSRSGCSSYKMSRSHLTVPNQSCEYVTARKEPCVSDAKSVVFAGYMYRTLNGFDKVSTPRKWLCEDSPTRLPRGWELAPAGGGSEHALAEPYDWSTKYVVWSNGKTTITGSVMTQGISGGFEVKGGLYKVTAPMCNAAILIRSSCHLYTITTTNTTVAQMTTISTTTQSVTQMITTVTTSRTNTSTTSIVAAIDCLLVVEVSNATQFVQEPNVSAVMKIAIARVLNVSVTWIATAKVSPLLDRRLDSHIRPLRNYASHERSLLAYTFQVAGGKVKVEFQIVILSSDMSFVIVKTILDKFDSVSYIQADLTINKILQSGVLRLPYYAKVKRLLVLNAGTPTPPNAGTSNTLPTSILVAVPLSIFSGLIFFLGILRFWYARRRRRQKKTKPLVDCISEWELAEFLCIPDAISPWLKAALDKYSLSLFSGVDAEVYVTCALGRRETDVQDIGPGLFYAMAVANLLRASGVQCLGNLRHVSMAMRQDDGADLIDAPNSRIRVMVVVETIALFQSEWCLREIFAALENKVEVLRLQFEEIPDGIERWPQKNLLNGNIRYQIGPRMFSLEEIKMSVLQKLDVLSRPPPSTVQQMIRQEARFLEDFVVDLLSKLTVGQRPSQREVIARRSGATSLCRMLYPTGGFLGCLET